MNTKKLKQLVLDLAIHGKLVPQDPNDEPASVLLERIKAASVETHGRASKNTKGKKSSISSEEIDEVPFEVPEGWCWCKLSTIASFSGGKTPSKDVKEYWDNGTNLWVTSKDMKSSRISDSMLKITDEALSDMTLYSPNTLLMVTRSGILRHSLPLAILDKPATINQDLKAITFLINGLGEYVFIVIKANESAILKDYHKDGTTVDSINFEKFVDYLIPLPPLAEQHRIVAAIEKWFAVIDQLEKNEADLKKSIEQTKKKVLDLAIRGKLVAQNPEDEPAGELLARIRADVETHGRASKSKKSSIPSVDLNEVPFEVPEGWEWCRMNDVCDIINGSTVEKTLEKENGQFAYLRVGDMNLPENKTEIVTSKTYLDNPLNLVPINSFIFPKRGGAILTNKKRSVRKFPIWIDLNLMAVNVIAADLFDYLFMFFSTIDLGKVCNGGNIPQINFSDIAKILVPLPPLAEQKRIVEKVEEVFGVLERIEGMVKS